jgi:O-6-methylguanine DNA methyltransferase
MTAPAALFASMPGPIGPIHLASTDRGVVAIELLSPSEAFIARLERRLGGPIAAADRAADGQDKAAGDPGRATRHLEAGRRAIRGFLEGDPKAFDDLPIDLQDRPAWDRAVLRAVRGLAWGEVSSYGAIARVIGRPGAARAVGGAVGRNPLSLAIPCHRVIAGDGTLGGYGGSWWGSREVLLGLKRDLLAREGVRVPHRAAGAPGAR